MTPEAIRALSAALSMRADYEMRYHARGDNARLFSEAAAALLHAAEEAAALRAENARLREALRGVVEFADDDAHPNSLNGRALEPSHE